MAIEDKDIEVAVVATMRDMSATSLKTFAQTGGDSIWGRTARELLEGYDKCSVFPLPVPTQVTLDAHHVLSLIPKEAFVDAWPRSRNRPARKAATQRVREVVQDHFAGQFPDVKVEVLVETFENADNYRGRASNAAGFWARVTITLRGPSVDWPAPARTMRVLENYREVPTW